MARGRNRNKLLSSEAYKAISDMKYEIASEIGLSVAGGPQMEDYWGHVTTRQAGAVGGEITKRMVAFAQSHLAGLSNTASEVAPAEVE